MEPLNPKQHQPITLLAKQMTTVFLKYCALGEEGIYVAKGLFAATSIIWGILPLSGGAAKERDKLIAQLIALSESNSTVQKRLSEFAKKVKKS
jgi:hypothetical protein